MAVITESVAITAPFKKSMNFQSEYYANKVSSLKKNDEKYQGKLNFITSNEFPFPIPCFCNSKL
jgi:hypothetical protein